MTDRAQANFYMHDKGPCARCHRLWGDHQHMWYSAKYPNACPYIPPPAGPTAILARQRVGGTIGTLDDIE